MIAISSEDGSLLKVFSGLKTETIGYHPSFGFVTGRSYNERAQNRQRHGLHKSKDELSFKFNLASASFENCEAAQAGTGWILKTPRGKFSVKQISGEDKVECKIAERKRERDNVFSILLLMVLLLPIIYLALPEKNAEEAPQVLEPVTVKITPEIQKPVSVPSALEQIPVAAKQNVQMKRAINQNLGFLGLLGRKDLTKAIGGAPTQLKDASPGAGPGGKDGSGGEVLVGLGQGLKRMTVGNSGVAGLGGVGTKGAGGGQGGYGNSQIGSGEGRGLSSIPLAQDVVLEGGLDRSVVQATIAKYLSQVRACYEQGLKNNPGLGGLVSMNFEINGSGNLNYSNVEKSTLGNSEVEGCIQARMMTWKFPNPRGGVNVKVTYPFLLRSAHS